MIGVSILMCVYNGERFIREAIESILSQTHHNLELIVIDDGSEDTTKSIIQAISDDRLKCFHNPTNLGLVYSRSKALSLASNELVAIQDADDYSIPTRITEQVNYLAENVDVALVGAWAEVRDENSNKPIQTKRWQYFGEALQYSLIFRNIFVHSSIMFRKSCIPTPPYPERFSVCEDYNFIAQISLRHKVHIIPRCLVSYRKHGGNTSSRLEFDIRELSSEVKRNLLHAYGFPLRVSEIHQYQFDQSQRLTSIEELVSLGIWLSKLHVDSKKSSLNHTVFESILRSEWHERCLQNCHLGWKVFTTFFQFRTLVMFSEAPGSKIFLAIKTLKHTLSKTIGSEL